MSRRVKIRGFSFSELTVSRNQAAVSRICGRGGIGSLGGFRFLWHRRAGSSPVARTTILRQSIFVGCRIFLSSAGMFLTLWDVQDNDDYRGNHKIVVQSVKMSLSRQDTVFLGGKLCRDLKNTGVIQNIKYDFFKISILFMTNKRNSLAMCGNNFDLKKSNKISKISNQISFSIWYNECKFTEEEGIMCCGYF